MRCLNARCARELADDWAFCDVCGKDNRPPRSRARVEEDEHFAPVGEFCVRCGVSILDSNDPTDPDDVRQWVAGGWAALVMGGLLLAASATLRAKALPKSDEGASILADAFVAGRLGSYLFAAGVVLLLVAPAVRRKRR